MGLAMQRSSVRVAIYARVSPKPEGAAGDNFSIASQLHAMRELALTKYGCAEADQYIDKDQMGGTLDRPELDRLRDNLAAKLYDVVIAYSPDRWTRGGRMQAAILDQEIEKAKARLDFCSGSYEDTPEGRFARRIQDDVSEYEREKFRERSRRCRRQKSRDGHPHACQPPDGYIYEGHKFGKKGEYVVVPERAKVVKLIFTKTAEGMTNSELARWMNEEGVKTYSTWRREQGLKERRKGHRWAGNCVAQVLKKTAYYGLLIQNGYEVKVPAIVSRELWNRAHEALAQNKVGRVGREPREYLLSGKLWCRRCGKRCTTVPSNGYPAYRCSNRDHTNRSIRFCLAPQISQSILEPVVWNAIWDAVCDPGLLWQLIEAYHERVAGRPSKKNPAVLRLERARRAVALAEKLLRDPDKPISYEQAKSDLDAAQRELAAALAISGAAVVEMPLRKDVDAACAAFRAMRKEIESFPGRRKALKLLVDKILYEDGEAEIICHLPASNAAAKSGGTKSNCHSRIRDNGNLIGPIPFIITCSIPPVPPEKWSRASLQGWETRRRKQRVA